MGCTLDHRPGHTITLRRGPPHPPSLGAGIGCLLLGTALQDRKMLPVERWALFACVHCAANHALRSKLIRRCERSTPNTSSEIPCESDRQRPALTCVSVCVRTGPRHD